MDGAEAQRQGTETLDPTFSFVLTSRSSVSTYSGLNLFPGKKRQMDLRASFRSKDS